MRAVLDSNVVLSSILFPHGRLNWLREPWREAIVTPLYSRDTAGELVCVLAYPKFHLTRDDRDVLLRAYLPYAEFVDVESAPVPRLPRCSDPADQVFLVVAAIGKADVLVTGDSALAKLQGQTPFPVESPAQFRKRFL